MASDLEEQLRLLPERPGVYIFQDEAARVLYVGKALSLRNRVRQYFQSSRNLPPKVQVLVGQIARVEHIVTDTEVEALILESNLIKRHRPKYNIRLRDDKHYPYIRLTAQEPWPRLLIARQMRKDGSRYFGPYTTAGAVHETLKLLRRIFPLRTCNDPSRHPRACLQLHIGRCLGPCLANFDRRGDYQQAVREVELFLAGRADDVAARLRRRMAAAADNLEFERAAELRNQLQAVQKVVEKQKIISETMADQDVVAFARGRDESCVQVFFVRQGRLVGRDQFLLIGTDDMTGGEILGAFLQQHYSRTNFVPPEILVAEIPADAGLLAEWLSQKRGSRVRLHRPQRGDKHQLVEMVARNAQEALIERHTQRERVWSASAVALPELQVALGLPDLPRRIECFDISHTQGAEVVAAMVVFVDGAPRKDDYRRFKIKVDQNDDFANMAEAIRRRFARGLAERAERPAAPAAMVAATRAAEAAAAYMAVPGLATADAAVPGQTSPPAKFATFPDLLIIDGGKGQLSAALGAMRALGVPPLPVFGLAKEEELLFAEGRPEPIRLPRNSAGLFLVQQVRDETHRFAVTFHRAKHRQAATRSRLDDIPGIGPKRRQALLRAFGSVRGIRQATPEELARVPGVTRELAEQVLEHLATRD